MRITVLVFSCLVLAYAMAMEGTSIYELVSGAYQVTLVGAFIPLVCGLYWSRATTQGAIFSLMLGVLLAGLSGAIVGMVLGSVAPQVIRNTHGEHHRVEGLEDMQGCSVAPQV
jgi:Na+(H+)/acetate symporter ActP